MKIIIKTLQEQIRNWSLIRRLALFELKIKYVGHTFGIVWAFLNPLLRIGVYWFAFGIGLKQGNPVHGVPYLYWMTVGLIVWFYISQALSIGTSSIYSKISVLSKSKFPLSIVPTFVTLSQLIEHVIITIFTLLVFNVLGYQLGFHTLQLPYFMFATTCILVSGNLLLGTLATVWRDVRLLLVTCLRFLMFLSPVLWSPDHLSIQIQQLLRLNPLFYLIDGYRASFLGDASYLMTHGTETVYFWILTLLMFMIGAFLNHQLKRNLLDYL